MHFLKILIKWILSIDLKINTPLLSKLIDSLLCLCEYSATSLISSFKQGFKFLQFNYEENDKFKPIFSFFIFLEKVTFYNNFFLKLININKSWKKTKFNIWHTILLWEFYG